MPLQPHTSTPFRSHTLSSSPFDAKDDDSPPRASSHGRLPLSPKDRTNTTTSTSLWTSTVSSSPPPPAPDSNDFLTLLDKGLQLSPASSKYHSDGHVSPISPSSTIRINRLSPSELERFGRGNHRLSFLRSSSPSSAKNVSGHHEALDEAKTAISHWNDEPRPVKPRPFNRFELVCSSDIVPSDSWSPRGLNRESADVAVFQLHNKSPDSIGRQVDGNADSSHHEASPPRTPAAAAAAAVSPPPQYHQLNHDHRFKRKASHLSFPSLHIPEAKRRRLAGLRKWASNICRGGGRRLSRAYHRWRQQNRQLFQDWRAKRRAASATATTNGINNTDRPGDPKEQKSVFGIFAFDRDRHGNEEWWKEGVAKYRAPSGIQFQK
ncbi:hypothetical protein CP533_1855 [Ophiocordyceps camponoti-saundersi (nom. inval.)]|nr:hypothetical protein CP533_1855 [Ophiocordyceps camponoti-saundersi (nom. inval.)]